MKKAMNDEMIEYSEISEDELKKLEEQFKNLPKLELPEINQEDLKQIKDLLKEEAI